MAMPAPLDHQLQGPRLTLRRFTEADVPRVCEILSNWRVTRMLRRAPPYPPNAEDLADWFANHEREWLLGAAYRFGAVATSRIVGSVDIGEIDRGVGDLGYWFDQACWGQGYGGEAAGLVRDFAFGTLGLRRLVAGHAIENVASGRILLRLGFRSEADELRYYPSRREEVPYRRYVLDAIT
jgi:[ribosomal protein S5]-alanine N-acetyltransferase